MMRNLFCIIILSLCFASCWDDGGPANEYEAFGVAVTVNGKLNIKDDSGGMLVPEQSISNFVSQGNRVWALFTADKAPAGDTVSVVLYDITALRECELQTGGLDTLGTDGVSLNRMWIAQDFLTLDIMVDADDESSLNKHGYAMFSDMKITRDTIRVEFRHNAKNDKGNPMRTGASLNLRDINPQADSTVIALKLKYINGNIETLYRTYKPKP